MKCPKCGTTMVEQEEDVRHEDLPGVMLEDVEVQVCPTCDNRVRGYPRVLELLEAVARLIVLKPTRLTATEIRFLLGVLDWSGADLARHFGTKPAVVSRWVNGHSRMALTADRLLRLAVVQAAGLEFELDQLIGVAQGEPEPTAGRLRFVDGRWEIVALTEAMRVVA